MQTSNDTSPGITHCDLFAADDKATRSNEAKARLGNRNRFSPNEMFLSTVVHQRGFAMKTIQSSVISVVTVAFLLGLGGCSTMTEREKSTAIGAGVGGVAGALLCGGVLCTAAGAAVGGVVGHEIKK